MERKKIKFSHFFTFGTVFAINIDAPFHHKVDKCIALYGNLLIATFLTVLLYSTTRP